jgi:hypothetical protein
LATKHVEEDKKEEEEEPKGRLEKVEYQSYYKCGICGKENREGLYDNEAEAKKAAERLVDEHATSAHPNYRQKQEPIRHQCVAAGINSSIPATSTAGKP